MQSFAASGKSRHDGSNWDVDDVGNFFVRKPLQLAERNDLAKLGRQLFDGGPHRLPILRAIECRAGSHRWIFYAVQFFIENNVIFLRVMAFQCRKGSVADDS